MNQCSKNPFCLQLTHHLNGLCPSHNGGLSFLGSNMSIMWTRPCLVLTGKHHK